MIGEFTLWNPKLTTDRNSIIEIPEEIKGKIAARVKAADEAWGFDCSKKYHSLNNYDNDDYLFVADMLLDICELHRTMYFHPEENKWVKGCTAIPHIHLEFIEEPVLKKDDNGQILTDDDGNYVADDARINMGVMSPKANGAHVLRFNYYWIKQYLSFLIGVFDDNAEWTVSLPEVNVEGNMTYGSIDELYTTAANLQKMGLWRQAQTLRLYALSQKDKKHILWPVLAFINKGTPQQIVTWVLFDDKRNLIYLDLKKKIYNTSAFAGMFSERRKLVTDLFTSSLKMILGHEVAHVARGHWNLRMKEPQYSMQREVMLNCEINADWTSMKWLVNELLYDTMDGNPYSRVLANSKTELIHMWAVRIFAAYVSLGWGYRGEERTWSTETIEKFIADDEATHPLYQIREACILMHAGNHLEHMKKACNKEENRLYTADGYLLNSTIFDEVWSKAMDMVNSFEVGIRTSWGKDARSIPQQMCESLDVERYTRPKEPQKLPYTLAKDPRTIEELERIENEWPNVVKHIKACGAFFPLDDIDDKD